MNFNKFLSISMNINIFLSIERLHDFSKKWRKKKSSNPKAGRRFRHFSRPKEAPSIQKSANYQNAIYLIYGQKENKLENIVRTSKELENSAADKSIDLSLIKLFHHP